MCKIKIVPGLVIDSSSFVHKPSTPPTSYSGLNQQSCLLLLSHPPRSLTRYLRSRRLVSSMPSTAHHHQSPSMATRLDFKSWMPPRSRLLAIQTQRLSPSLRLQRLQICLGTFGQTLIRIVFNVYNLCCFTISRGRSSWIITFSCDLISYESLPILV